MIRAAAAPPLGDGFAHAGIHRAAHRLVERLLGFRQINAVEDLGPGRQFGGDRFLRAAQQERAQAPVQPCLRGGVAVFLDRRSDQRLKALSVAQ